jgi:signal transduction histidine kinase
VRWFRRLSLRARLTFIGTGGLAIALAIGGLLILLVLNYTVIRSVDQNSRQTAREVGALVETGTLPRTIPSAGTSIVQVLDDDRRIGAATAGADELTPVLDEDELDQAQNGDTVVVSGRRVGAAGTLRVVERTAGEGEKRRYVIVATPTKIVQQSIDTVRNVLLVAYPLLLAGLAVLAWRVIGAALRPVEELRLGAEQISARSNRAGPLPVPDGDDEVHRLAVTLNDMLDRLDAGRARQRAFVADAAHELRSPIASLRTQLEVADRLDEPAPAADLLTDVTRLSRLVDDLLLLARADEGDPALRLDEAVDLTEVARDAATSHVGARVAVTADGTEPVHTIGDPVSMRRVIDNLVGNAVRHASTAVHIQTAQDDDETVRLSVVDDGPGIPAADRERVFDRFTRLDNARARDEGGAGLGLAIVRELVRQHSGTVTLGDADPGLRVDVVLPAHRRKEPAPAESETEVGAS